MARLTKLSVCVVVIAISGSNTLAQPGPGAPPVEGVPPDSPPATPEVVPPAPPVMPEPPPKPDPKPEAKPDPKPEAKAELKLGGFVFGGMYYDTNTAIVRPWLVRVTGKSDKGGFDVDPLGTRLNMTGTYKKGTMEAKGFLEVDLKTGDLGRLREAYASIGGDRGTVLAGQAYTLVGGWMFIDSLNIDAFFIQGGAWTRQPQVRYSRNFGDLGLHVAALTMRGMGAVVVNPALVGTAAVTEQSQVPALQVRIQHKLLDKGFVAVAGAVGNFEVSFTPGMMSPTMAFKKTQTGAMVAFDVNVPFGKNKLLAHGWYSRSGGNSSGVQQAVVIDTDGSLVPVTAFGGFLNLVFELAPGLRLSAYGAVDDPKNTAGDTVMPTKQNLTGGVMVAKKLLEKLEAGLEIQYALTKAATDNFNDIRTTAAFKYFL